MRNDFGNFKGSIFTSISLNNWLIIINAFCFLLFTILISTRVIGIENIAIGASNVFAGKYLWTFITSMFMHGSFFHLFVNMISLFFVGSLVEKIIGRKRYLWFYMVSGIVAGLFFVVFAKFFGTAGIGLSLFGSPEDFAVGASGAIFGLIGLLAVLIPKGKIYLIGGPMIAIIAQAIIQVAIPNSPILGTLNILVTVYIFFSIFAMFSVNPSMRKIALPLKLSFAILPLVAIIPLMIIGLFVKLPIGNMAHLGGLIAGLGYGFYLRKKYKRKTSYIRKYFS